jgi:predicted negative regulator of RcsB-dependent stress response
LRTLALDKVRGKALSMIGNGRLEKVMTEKNQLDRLRKILAAMTGENWKAKRDQALRVLRAASWKQSPIPVQAH